MADVVFFYKVVNNHLRLTLDSRLRFSRDVDRGYALRSMDTSNLLTSLSRTDLFKFSFTKRIVREWNSLPLDIREASSVEDFEVFEFLCIHFLFLFFFGVCVYTFIGRSVRWVGVSSLNGAVALFEDSSHFNTFFCM